MTSLEHISHIKILNTPSLMDWAGKVGTWWWNSVCNACNELVMHSANLRRTIKRMYFSRGETQTKVNVLSADLIISQRWIVNLWQGRVPDSMYFQFLLLLSCNKLQFHSFFLLDIELSLCSSSQWSDGWKCSNWFFDCVGNCFDL